MSDASPQSTSNSPSKLSISAGPGVIIAPLYPGAENLRILPIPAVDIRYDRFFINGRDGLGFTLADDRSTGLQVGISGFVRFNRNENDDAVRLRGLGDLPTALQGRIFVSKQLGPVSVRAVAAHDFGATNGTTLDVSASYGRRLGRSVNVSIGPSISLADTRFNRGFFGIDPAQAVRGARAPYEIGAGVYQVGADVGLNWRFSAGWSASTFVSYKYLTGRAAESPVTARRQQPSGAISLAYGF